MTERKAGYKAGRTTDDAPTIIREEGRRDNFFMMPNVIDNLELDVYEFRLYCHLKRVAGEYGSCFQSVKTMAYECSMSTDRLMDAKKSLAKRGLIAVTAGNYRAGLSDSITIADIWARNTDYATAKSAVNNASSGSQPLDNASSGCNRIDGSHTKNTPIQEDKDMRGTAPRPVPSSSTELPDQEQAGVEQKKRRRAAAAPSAGTRAIQDAYAKACGFPVPWQQGESKAAKWLADHGYTPEQVAACYAALKAQPFWSDKTLRLASIVSQIGEWSKRNANVGAAASIPLDANGREMVLTPSGKWVVAQ